MHRKYGLNSLGIIMFGPRTYTPATHDFFNDVATLMVNFASFNAAVESFWNSSSTQIPTTPNHRLAFYGRVAHASFEIHSLMHGVVRNSWPTQIELVFERPAPPVAQTNVVQLQGGAIANMLIQQVGTAFLRYYERNKHRPVTAYPGHPRTWPELWRFAWLLRNAIAHSDTWSISDPTFPNTTWQGVTVGGADSGKPWFDASKYIGGGDVLLLMEELEASAI